MYPSDLRYTKDHEWLREEGDVFTVGITAFAAEQLGDVTYVELPEVGSQLHHGSEAGSVESVKAASDIYAPVGGEVAEINDELEGRPELVNESPYGEGWFFKLENVDTTTTHVLMDAKTYEEFIEEQRH